MRQKLRCCPASNVVIGQPISHRIDHMLSGTRANIAVKIFGDDLATLRSLARQVEADVRQTPGVVDLSTEQQTEVPTIRISTTGRRWHAYGLPPVRRLKPCKPPSWARKVGRIFEGQLASPWSLRYPPEDHADLESIRATLFHTPPASGSAFSHCRHPGGPRSEFCDPGKRSAQDRCHVQRCRARSARRSRRRSGAGANPVPLPQGYRVEYGGQFESEASGFRIFLLAGARRGVGNPLHSLGLSVRLRDALINYVQSAAGFDRRGCRRFPFRRHPFGGLDDRLHHPVRDRRSQRDHAGVAHQACTGKKRASPTSAKPS